MQPATIKIFLTDGKPDGIRTSEISNWSGMAIAGPRSDLKLLRERAELNNVGIYFLVGEDPASGELKIYIGEAEDISARLGNKSHLDREFWVSTIAFVSKDQALTKAHAKYLEGKLITKALELGINTDNSQQSGARLPESDRADMDQFLEKLYQLLPILGLHCFAQPEKVEKEDVRWLSCKIKGLIAKGRRTQQGFLVQEGSQAVAEHREGSSQGIKNQRDKLIVAKKLIPVGDHLVFTQDIELSSPSAAASIVRGGNTNGLSAWRDIQGKRLQDLEFL